MQRVAMFLFSVGFFSMLLAGCKPAAQKPQVTASRPPAADAAREPPDDQPQSISAALQAEAPIGETVVDPTAEEQPPADDDPSVETAAVNTQAEAAGMEALQEGDYETAIEHFTTAIDAGPSPTLYYYRGVACDMADKKQEAIADLTRCLAQDPQNTRALYSRHLVYRNLEKWDEAFTDVKLAHEVDGDDFRIANAYAMLLIGSPNKQHHDATQAVKIATHACELTEWQDSICISTLADAYRAAGDAAKADEFAEKAKKLESFTYDYDFDAVREEIKDYFAEQMEKAANDVGLQEIVPGKVGVSVWTIDRKDKSQPNLIFTTGMSELPMTVPDDVDENPFAEVCMFLPPDWPTQPKLEDSAKSWPWIWLRMVAHYPHEKDTYIGEYPSVFPVEGPLKPLGEGSKFTALLLVPNFGALEGFQSDEGPPISIITAIPLYIEEYELAKQDEGIPKLFQKFQKAKISEVFNDKRPNVALEN